MKNNDMDLNLNSNSFVSVKDVVIPDLYYRRLKTGVKGIDCAFGGGFLPGSIFTLTGSPGAGKTTYLLQTLHELGKKGYKVGYASGEECVEMLACSCKRLSVTEINISNETNINELIEHTKDLDMMIIDSFASLTSNIKSSRAHEKHCVQELCKAAKANECTIGIVLHISKTGQYKGGTVIPHTVDVVAHLHRDMIDGQPDNYVSLSVNKNRFGPTGEMQLMMTSKGYDWNYKPAAVPKQVNARAATPKRTKKAKEVAILLKENKVTVARAAKLLKCNRERCQYLLNQLTRDGKMVKSGRGVRATYKKKI